MDHNNEKEGWIVNDKKHTTSWNEKNCNVEYMLHGGTNINNNPSGWSENNKKRLGWREN